MEAIWMTLWALLMVTVAGYAQYRIAAHTAGQGKVALTRGVLAVIGIGLGVTGAAYYPHDRQLAALAFMIGFGLVHVPAAVILFIKRGRGEGKS
jgi:hypothetical protein